MTRTALARSSLGLFALLSAASAMRFLVNHDQEVCFRQYFPKNEQLITQVIVDKDARDFRLDVIHMNDKGTVIGSTSTVLHNSRDVYVHQEDEPVYVCIFANTTKKINIEVIPNLMLPDQETFPTADDGDKLQRALFVTNSKMMELINQHVEFEHSEHAGMEANVRVEDSLRNLLFIELLVVVSIAVFQFLILRSFANKLKRM